MVVIPIGIVLVLVVMLACLSFDPLAFVLVLTRLLMYLMASVLALVLAVLGVLVCPLYLSAVVPVAFALVLHAGLFVVLVGVGRCWCVRRTRWGGAGGDYTLFLGFNVESASHFERLGAFKQKTYYWEEVDESFRTVVRTCL